MPRISIKLYWLAVAFNVLALGILLFGIFTPIRRTEQVLAVVFTGTSLVLWLLYFQTLKK
jgi:hypothetical protein